MSQWDTSWSEERTGNRLQARALELSQGGITWHSLKASSGQQRAWWKAVGEALLVGRRLHPSNQKFGLWCAEVGFGDMDFRDRADSMWLAENWSAIIASCDNTLSHPRAIRQWHRENPPPEPTIEAIGALEAPRPRITIETAKKVNKLASMAERGEGKTALKRVVKACGK